MWMDHRGKAMKQLGHITTWVIKGARVAEVQSMAEFLEWGVNGVSFFEDSNPQCRKWAKAGDCIQNEGFMTENCRRACNELTNPPTGFSPANGKQLKQAAALWIADLHAAEAKYGKVGKWAIRGSLGNKEVHHMGELLDVAVDQLKGCPSDQYYSSFLRRCVAMRR